MHFILQWANAHNVTITDIKYNGRKINKKRPG